MQNNTKSVLLSGKIARLPEDAFKSLIKYLFKTKASDRTMYDSNKPGLEKRR